MSKYRVEFRAFHSGEWYRKNGYKELWAAENMMRYSMGRDARVINSHSGKVVATYPGDPSIYEKFKNENKK